MKKIEPEMEDKLRPEYGLRNLPVSGVGSGLKGFGERVLSRLKSAKFKKFLTGIFVLGTFLFCLPFIWRLFVQLHYGRMIYLPDTSPSERVAIVFGAGIRGDGFLSDMLRDRMDVAISLYEQGKVQKLLLSGDNSFENYDEPGAMLAYAIREGVDPDDIQPDYGGRRTYDTCYRARHIFQVEKAILVTQSFHLPRALFTCTQVGVDAIGVSADLQPYIQMRWLTIREVGATVQSLADALQQNPPPIMGDPIPLEN